MLTESARSVQKNIRNAVHLVLAHLYRNLHEANKTAHNTDNDIEYDDEALFQQMLVRDIQEGEDITAKDNHESNNVEIFSVQVEFQPTTDGFLGVCIDSGAKHTVAG